MSDDDKVLRFPGGKSADQPAAKRPSGRKAAQPPIAGVQDFDPTKLSEARLKALQIVVSGMPFVMIGIQSTKSGADFFTAIDGDAQALKDAAPHLDGVIQRALAKRGL